jgi:hypothetical protein
MGTSEKLSLRDSIKVACLDFAVSQGLDEDGMINLFQRATVLLQDADQNRNAVKTGGVGAALWALLGAGLLPIALASAGAAGLSHVAGQTVGDAVYGQVPTDAQFKMTDELAAYERNTDEILERIKQRKARDAAKSKPSVRRMF